MRALTDFSKELIRIVEQLTEFYNQFIISEKISKKMQQKSKDNNPILKLLSQQFFNFQFSREANDLLTDTLAQITVFFLIRRFEVILHLNSPIVFDPNTLFQIPLAETLSSDQFFTQLINFFSSEEKLSWNQHILDLYQIFSSLQKDLKKNWFESPFSDAFYVQFLSIYSHELQKKRGIIYTPAWIAESIISWVLELLSKKCVFSKDQSDLRYQIYYPAMGSWTFERALIRALSAFPEKFVFSFSDQDPFSWQLSGNDLNLPALCIGELLTKDYLAFLDPKNNSSDSNFSANIYVQNALTPTFQEWLTLHSRPEDPLIIIGNPPYAVSSSNKDAWIIDLMKTYAVSEPNLTRLYDDYVKFIRYGQWLLEQRSVGILAFITNRKYLDGKIFYGMRHSLLQSFDALYVIDLFGDSRNVKQENSDQNIFGIQTGVAILFVVKYGEHSDDAELKYLPCHGSISFLQSQLLQPLEALPFQTLQPRSPNYLFVPIQIAPELEVQWNKECIPLPNCFVKTSRAMISSRDAFMINLEPQQLHENITALQNRDFKSLREHHRLGSKKDALLENEAILQTFDFDQMHQAVIPITYRPFDY